MEKFVSSWSNGKILPESYIFPPEKRPGKRTVPVYRSVPIIDLGKAEGDDRAKIVHQIVDAGYELGFFQVINHGVPKRLMEDTRNKFKEFFELPADEEKIRLLSGDLTQKKCVLVTRNADYDKEKVHNWIDSLRHDCTPLEECMDYWPQNPPKYREVVGEYVVKVKELGSKILELISDGLGLERGFFERQVTQEHVLTVHNYPPCPDPSLTLGTRKHCDPGLITILLQGTVLGLQVFNNGEWLAVDPIPDAFVINIGHQLQIVSNGKLTSSEHRAVTNRDEARITAAFFVETEKECVVEPAKVIVNAQNPGIYRGVRYKDLLQTFKAAYMGEIDDVLEPYTIRASKP